MYPIIIDANVWIKFARSRNIAPLLDRMVTFGFLPIVNNYLLSEIFNALVENKWMNKAQATFIIDFIKKISLVITESSVYRLSPDPKDNYLFDLAIQNNCVFIISDDNKLLQFKLRPVPVHSTRWFLKKFIVH
jgi:putative PIN family toxin of toxin-antitoxin system